ncbi:hypothetical protein O181_006288 [Austropuccinia psidii MF-1]|uniref:Reverse transcriptase Ty1/copia-type domain-containing protein n=1 Tax=Austropuccinia psidii MF-1 TaxID=1389203 RepID=A0A9Q3BK81_9BASI|nr:hypothetical protein [Austropuccinia psidii MF-1]
MEAEYKALSDIMKETMWFLNLCKEINLPLSDKPIILNNNKGAIDLALCKANHNSFKTKHMELKLHYIREHLQDKKIKLQHVSTQKKITNFLTKAVGNTSLKNSPISLNLMPNSVCSLPDTTLKRRVLHFHSSSSN